MERLRKQNSHRLKIDALKERWSQASPEYPKYVFAKSGDSGLTKMFGFAMVVLVIIHMFVTANSYDYGTDTDSAMVTFAVGAPLIALAILAYVMHDRRVRHRREIVSTAIFEQLKEGKPTPPYFVFLRPFFSDKALSRLDDGKGSFGLFDPTYYGKQQHDFHAVLSDALLKDGLTLGLGDQGAPVGLAQLQSTDEGWKDDIALLIANAKALFIVPSANEGTAEELRLIAKNDLYEQTIFVLPPQTQSFDAKGEWERARNNAAKFDLVMPSAEHIPTQDGALVRVRSRAALQADLAVMAEKNLATTFPSSEYHRLETKELGGHPDMYFAFEPLGHKPGSSSHLRDAFVRIRRPVTKDI